MDLNIPLTGSEVVLGLAGFALTGWNLYVGSQKSAIEKEATELRKDHEKSVVRLEALEKMAFLRTEHKEFRIEIIALIDKMSLTFSTAIDKLSDRLEKFMEEERRRKQEPQ